ncbi:MAG: hypothetical protein HY033_10995 [Ignavibacteriae bacterium]|nr:hypothetical protein [Ignavibacteria bacterium]MBI3365425.1 hypothetical protein [Ignavibacteriota bacterium]
MRVFSFAAILAGFSCVHVSCLNPFAPRLDTELGQQSCGDLRQIENIFCTFRNAYSFKDTTVYGSLLASDFVFIYTDYDALVERNWGREDEMRLTYSMFQSVQSLSLIWNREIPISESDTSTTVERGYNLTVAFGPADIVRVDGVAEFLFVRSGPDEQWKILRWHDKSNF